MSKQSNLSKGFFSHFKGDLLGGLTAGIVALPLALAFGAQSGMGASAGLVGAIFIGFFASMFGGTATQISGPTAPMTAVSMLIVQGILQTNNGILEDALPYILIVFLLAGLFQIIFGIIKLGGLIQYIPYSVVSGFMTGIGVIILITQLLALVGYVPKNDINNVNSQKLLAEEVLLKKILKDEAGEDLLVLEDFNTTAVKGKSITEDLIIAEAEKLVSSDSAGVLGALKYLPQALQDIDWLEFMLAILTILIIFGFKRITTAVPSTLIALLVVTATSYFAGLDVMTIGNIPSGFPSLHLEIFSSFNIGQIAPYIFTAISLALLGSIDSLLTSIVADNMTKTKHSSNKELIGQGIGNSVAALFGGIPGAGATIRTVVNINSGGRTRLSGIIAALLLLVILLVLSPLAELIPAAVLAGILITVGISVIDYKGLRALKSMPISDAIVLIVVLVLTVFWDLIFAVAIGLVISSLMFMKKMADISTKNSKILSLEQETNDADQSEIPTPLKEEVYIKQISGPLFFGFSNSFQQLASQIPKDATTLIIKMGRVPYMDKSGFLAMEDILFDLNKKNIKILLCNLKEQPRYMLESFDVIPQLVAEEQIFEKMEDCIEWVDKNIEDTTKPS